MKTCSIHDCKNPVLALGYCRKHYLRHYKHGDPNHVSTGYQALGEDSPNFRHGHWDHPLYKTWRNMMSRCYNESDRAFKNYGARGITVCESWHDIQNFIDDMGDRPKGMSVDRADNSKGYSPENCRWANDTTQSRNRRFAKLSIEKAEQMRAMKKNGATRKQVALAFGVSESSVKKVLSGAYWKTE